MYQTNIALKIDEVEHRIMNIGFVIGNGTSRERFDLHQLDGKGLTIGCNLLYKDYNPDYITAVDLLAIEQIESYITFRKPTWKFVTRKVAPGDWKLKLIVDGKELGKVENLNGGHCNNSGVFSAAFFAEILKLDVIYLIGIDFFRPTPNRINDIYSGYIGYSNSIPYMWNMLFERNPNTMFIRVGEILENDEEFYKTQLFGLNLIDNFDEFLSHVDSTME
jgi:hypothetical protein